MRHARIGLEPEDRRLLDEAAEAARNALGERFEEVWASGEELELPAAVELDLEALGCAGEALTEI